MREKNEVEPSATMGNDTKKVYKSHPNLKSAPSDEEEPMGRNRVENKITSIKNHIKEKMK